jgi:uncharacterized protein with HEPN domain
MPKPFMKNDLVFLKHILESILDIDESLKNVSYDDFLKSKILLKATVRDLEIIGEAANKVSQEFRVSNPEIPWNDMIGMRNVLIHEYFGVIPETVWNTCQKNLPELRKNVEKILSEK